MPYIDPMPNLEQLKRTFIESTPRAPKKVCQHLGNMQEFSQGQLLFDDAEMDLALWAHSRSYRTSAEESETDVPSGLQPYAHLVAALMPTKLEWGAVSHFQDNVIAALDSPVIHAWLFSDEAAPGAKKKPVSAALIVGRGVPAVRERVMNAALSCLLAVDPHPNNLLLEGLIQIHAGPPEPESEENGRRTWRDLIIGGFFAGPHSEVVISENAAEAMEKLSSTLTLLAAHTSLVSVHQASSRDHITFNRQIERQIRDTQRRDSVYLWSGNNPQFEIAVCRPVGRTDTGRSFQLHLNAELLDSPLYKSLQENCRASLVGPILADMERRIHFYQDELEQHQSKYDWYQKLSDKEKSILPDVIADREIDWEMVEEVMLAEPRLFSAQEYYTKGMLYKIEQDKKYLEYVNRISQRMEALLKHPDAPMEGLIAARLFDAAIRDVTLSENPDINELFNCWKRLVQPMLWLEWRRALERSGIAESDLCTRHTVFNVQAEKANSKLTLTPLTLVDSVRSVIVFDAGRKILVVRDPTDYAETYPAKPDLPLADHLYAAAQGLAEQGASQQDVKSRLLDALRAAPAHTLCKVAAEWLEHFPVKQEEFETIREAALAKNRPISSAFNALRWCNELCLFSATEAVDKALDEGAQRSTVHAAALLMRAYIKCLQAGYPWDALAGLLTGSRAAPELQEAAADLFEANRLCPDVVRTFVQLRVLAPQLFLPAGSLKMTPGEEGALCAERAVEAANLAAEFENAMALLAPTKEWQRGAYAKLMPAVERCFAADFVPPPSGLTRLIELLTGRKRAAAGA